MYANLMADALASQICSPSIAQVPSQDPHVLEFMDISADESNGHISDDDSISYFSSSSREAAV